MTQGKERGVSESESRRVVVVVVVHPHMLLMEKLTYCPALIHLTNVTASNNISIDRNTSQLMGRLTPLARPAQLLRY